jgi:hypothetical protein
MAKATFWKPGVALLMLSGIVALTARALGEERIGSEIPVVASPHGVGDVRAATDGIGTVVTWVGWDEVPAVFSAHIDGAGLVSGPFRLTPTAPYRRRQHTAIASDGRTALVAWAEEDLDDRWEIKAVRLGPDGQALDPIPITVTKRPGRQSLRDVSVAYDGAFFRVLWSSGPPDRRRVFTRRVGVDGAPLAKVVRVRTRLMASLPFDARLACQSTGDCLAIWQESAGFDHIQGARIAGDRIIDREVRRLLDDVREPVVTASDGDYLIVGLRRLRGCGSSFCG